ncbi:MAG: putative peptidoglycan glycosyltransferase FtsW [Verrucomicrobiota bacterium]
MLILCVLALTSVGLTVLFSAGGSSDRFLGTYFARQLVWFFLAIIAGGTAFFCGVSRLRRLVLPGVVASIVLLVVVLVPGIGIEVNAARRWIDLGPMRLQSSEFAKIGFLCLLAWYVARNGRQMDHFLPGFLVPAALVAPFAVLLILEPDLGTTVLYMAVAGAILLAAGTPFGGLLLAGCASVVGFTILVLRDPERLERVTSFLDPEGHRTDGGYQLWQGILGFSVGGMDGAGPGRGRQHLSFLPEAHTDFIFAVVGEELGFFATGGVVLLFVLFTVLALSQIRKAPDLFQFTFVFGALLFVIGQATINMGVVTGLLPTKGMSLPFLSYGGSNLVVMGIITGFILSTFRDWEGPVIRRPVEIE